MDLMFDMIGAYKSGELRHPQEVMKALRIHYMHATPQTLGDCWWFWCCEKMTQEPLPSYITPIKLGNAFDYIGFGLSEESAQMIEDWRKT